MMAARVAPLVSSVIIAGSIAMIAAILAIASVVHAAGPQLPPGDPLIDPPIVNG
ncbi:MAG: hypothetical protein IVW54_06245 [Candidatus Binataceae bacterium]|nr:hypothetical protein [Candidatus Binataceae bacterium]